jgi:uncharacterized protein DUF5670
MFWMMIVMLVALWLHFLLMAHAAGGFMQFLLAIATIVVLFRVISARKAR